MSFEKGKDQKSVLKGYNMLLYFAGSMIMYEPAEECVSDFWSNGILTRLPVESRNPRFITAASQLRESCRDKTVCTRILKEDYKRLIAGTDTPLASPVKSFHDRIPGNGMKEESVTDFYNAYGWRFRSRYNIPDDHLGIELLFLTLMVDNYLAMDDDVCLKEMRHEIRRYVEKHLYPFIPLWNDLIQEYAHTICYKGIATLIFACVEDIYYLLEDNSMVLLRAELKN